MHIFWYSSTSCSTIPRWTHHGPLPPGALDLSVPPGRGLPLRRMSCLSRPSLNGSGFETNSIIICNLVPAQRGITNAEHAGFGIFPRGQTSLCILHYFHEFESYIILICLIENPCTSRLPCFCLISTDG